MRLRSTRGTFCMRESATLSPYGAWGRLVNTYLILLSVDNNTEWDGALTSQERLFHLQGSGSADDMPYLAIPTPGATPPIPVGLSSPRGPGMRDDVEANAGRGNGCVLHGEIMARHRTRHRRRERDVARRSPRALSIRSRADWPSQPLPPGHLSARLLVSSCLLIS